MRTLKFSLLAFFLFIFLLMPNKTIAQTPPKEEKFEALVTKILEKKLIKINGREQLYEKIEVRITDGSLKDKHITLENGKIPLVNVQEYKVGDRLIVTKSKDGAGHDTYLINDYVRRNSLFLLFLIFAALVVIIGRKKGLFSILGMGFSFFIIFIFLLPQISQGRNPILITILASSVIIPLTFYLSHGFNLKTTAAVLGTLIALVITGILASLFVGLTKLSGFSSEEAGFLTMIKQDVFDMKALLLSGIIIGVLGILDDITISQAAIVYQLKNASSNLSIQELYSRAMDVGKDHIASVVNTLVLVYTGAAMPLLLLFIGSANSFGQAINFEIVAEEVVRTLVASIGLILAVPITTFIAVLLVYKKIKL